MALTYQLNTMEERTKIFDVDRQPQWTYETWRVAAYHSKPVSSTFWISFSLFPLIRSAWFSRSVAPSFLTVSLQRERPGGFAKSSWNSQVRGWLRIAWLDRLNSRQLRIFAPIHDAARYEETRIEMFVVVSHDFGIDASIQFGGGGGFTL